MMSSSGISQAEKEEEYHKLLLFLYTYHWEAPITSEKKNSDLSELGGKKFTEMKKKTKTNKQHLNY